MRIYFKKRFWWEKEMTESEALDMAQFCYSKIQTVYTQEKRIPLVNKRFIWIQFTAKDLNNLTTNIWQNT